MEARTPTTTSRYAPSPLARHASAMRTAAALLLLDVSPSSINFELRRQHGLTEGEAALVIREAAQLEQRAERRRTTRRRPGR